MQSYDGSVLWNNDLITASTLKAVTLHMHTVSSIPEDMIHLFDEWWQHLYLLLRPRHGGRQQRRRRRKRPLAHHHRPQFCGRGAANTLRWWSLKRKGTAPLRCCIRQGKRGQKSKISQLLGCSKTRALIMSQVTQLPESRIFQVKSS